DPRGRSPDRPDRDHEHPLGRRRPRRDHPERRPGAAVRDLVLGRPSLDFDLVLEGDAISLGRSLVSKFGGKLTVHTKFKTEKWFPGLSAFRPSNLPTFIDLISARSETYKHPAALPTVKLGTVAADIRRRDFTLNALAICLDGEYFGELRDELGGLDDLQNGLVRVLHPRSFVDDPTRLFRAARYEKRYDFKIEPQTLTLIPEARPLIAKLSAQRIRHELDLILGEPNALSILARLGDLDLLKPIHPSLTWDVTTWARFQHKVNSANERWLLWLMSLTETEIASLNQRLKFTASLLKSLYASSKIFAALSAFEDLKPSQCVERLNGFPLNAVSAAAFIAQGKSRQNLEKYLSEWRHIKPKTTGDDLKNLGIAPGPKYQEILSRLRNAWLDGEVDSENEEKRLIENFLKETG
ncbi:MAG: CCA tRNA nucleotidyltransferase, partial [Chloroflexi bacterium]|nr:CCA tRNA nucleotidyltransferase [Chloroflexota bacterium]